MSGDVYNGIALLVVDSLRYKALELVALVDGMDAVVEDSDQPIDKKIELMNLNQQIRDIYQKQYEISKEYVEKLQIMSLQETC